jgi:Fe-S cluster biogenesis protein NfuA
VPSAEALDERRRRPPRVDRSRTARKAFEIILSETAHEPVLRAHDGIEWIYVLLVVFDEHGGVIIATFGGSCSGIEAMESSPSTRRRVRGRWPRSP